MNHSEILALLQKDLFHAKEVPKTMDVYEYRLIRAFESGVAQGKKEACERLTETMRQAVFSDNY